MKTVVDFENKTIVKMPDVVRPALCLDLDGTVRHSRNGKFINTPDDIVLFAGVEEKIWEYRDNGYLIFGITNQGGVAYGFKTPLDNEKELDRMIDLFNRNPFHIIKACFHHPNGKVSPYNHRSLLRKPDIGMLAICEADAWEAGIIVDWDNSLFVGDRPEDKECAKNAGIAFRWADEFFGREMPGLDGLCYECRGPLGMLPDVITLGDATFCGDFCAEKWQDKRDNHVL